MQPVDTSNDQQLFAAFFEGKSDEAFRALVNRHSPWVFAAANRQLHDHQLAEDATQAVFILLLRKSPIMRSRHQLTAWLFNAMNYSVKNMLRARRRRQFHELRAIHGAVESDVERSRGDELSDRLDAAVKSLPPRYRTAILLRFYQNLSFDQIGHALQISEAAARKRTSRGVEKLRRRFGVKGASFSAGSLGEAAASGMHPAPTALAQVVSQSALAAKAGAAIPQTVALATKGTAYLMATAKLKAAVILTAVVLAITISTGIATIHFFNTAAPSASVPPPATAPADNPAPAGPYDFYRLKNNEVLKYFPTAPEYARRAVYDEVDPTHNNGPRPPDSYVIQWLKDPALAPAVIWRNRGAYRLTNIADIILHADPQDIEGNDDDFLLPGDFAVDATATDEARAGALQAICQESFGKHIALSFQDVDRKVIVITGQWNYTRAAFQRPNSAGAPVVEIYDDVIRPNSSPTVKKDSAALADGMGRWVGKTVIVEAQNIPDSVILYFNEPIAGTKNIARILDHFCQQTGLQWSEQTRNIRRLIVEKTP